MPRTQPAARSQGRDCLQFSVLRSPSLTPPHHLPPLRSGFGYIWVESRTQACPCRPLPGSPPALRSQVNVSQRAKGAPRLPPLPRRQAPLQALRSSFPGRPRSVFRSLGSGGLAWAPVTYPSLRPGSRPGSSSHLASGPPPLQPPADAPPPPVAAPSPAPAVFTRGGRGGAGGGSANQRLSGSEKGWWREEEAVRDGRERGDFCSKRGPPSCGRLAWSGRAGLWTLEIGLGSLRTLAASQSSATTTPLLGL